MTGSSKILGQKDVITIAEANTLPDSIAEYSRANRAFQYNHMDDDLGFFYTSFSANANRKRLLSKCDAEPYARLMAIIHHNQQQAEMGETA